MPERIMILSSKFLLVLIFLTQCTHCNCQWSTCIRLKSVHLRKSFTTLSMNSAIEFDRNKEIKSIVPQGTSSLMTSSTNLVKNSVGAGVFSLASRVTSQNTNLSIVGVTFLVLGMAIWATYCFLLIGKTCEMTGSSTYSKAWANTVSKESDWIVQTVVVIAPIISCLANTIVLSDIFGITLASLGLPSVVTHNRNFVIALLGTIVLFPLCTQKDLSRLKAVSLIGILGHLTAVSAFGLRIWDRSYAIGGKYFLDALHLDSPCHSSPMSSWFVLTSLISYCMVTHYNAPRYYNELAGKDKAPAKFPKMVLSSYLTASAIYMMSILLPRGLFGASCKSFALNSFSSADPIASVARVAFGTSVLASYPLIFLSMRNWFVALASKRLPALAGTKRISTLLLLAICSLTTQVRDIGVVGSIAGGIFGCSMMFVFPPIMYIRALQARDKCPTWVRLVNYALAIFGAGIGLFGTYHSILPLLLSR